MSLIQASLPLRRQLLDQLIHDVVRHSGKKLLFRVSPEGPAPSGGGNRVSWSCIAPFEGGITEMITIKDFLSRTVVRLPNTRFTVKDTISFLANKSGGVHTGVAKEENELEFVWMGTTLGVGGMPSFAFIFVDIIKTFIISTEELYQFAKSNITTG
ncbi:MAG: hypothetical protein ACU0HS_01535 [Paracoccus sp. (in: a-proteobacteria)]|uniref:hypothetical protein n=1 Tax=Paracoccus sp. TaxID=267 RepID=UPI00405972CA